MKFTTAADNKKDENFAERYLRIDMSKVDTSEKYKVFLSRINTRLDSVRTLKSKATKTDSTGIGELLPSTATTSSSRTLTSMSSGGPSASASMDDPFVSNAPAGRPSGRAPTSIRPEDLVYQPLLSLLAWMSLYVFNSMNGTSNQKCIVFQSCHFHNLGGLERSRNKPDIVGVWAEQSEAQEIIQKDIYSIPASRKYDATEILSLIEVKVKMSSELILQIGSYASVLPCAQPNFAGLLYLTCCSQFFRFYWSDASRVVCSPRYSFRDDSNLLFHFFNTLYHPLDDLPRNDPTIAPSPKSTLSKPEWIVKTTEGDLKATKLFSTPAWGKQTWIFRSEPYIIKDLWRDEYRRFSEGAVLERIHADGIVPGVVRLASYEDVKVTNGDGPAQMLQTSNKHSHVFCVPDPASEYWKYKDVPLPPRNNGRKGKDRLLARNDGDKNGDSTTRNDQPVDERTDECKASDDVNAGGLPSDSQSAKESKGKGLPKGAKGQLISQRIKTRTVLESFGERLDECKSLLQLLKIAYDIVVVHQFCLMDRKSLHRDISKNNILINPVHVQNNKKLNPRVGKYIEQVLDPNLKEVKEVAMLIDWDNAALFGPAAEPVTDRTGTPMFIAVAVSEGQFQQLDKAEVLIRVPELPTISEEAKQLYIAAYGKELYEKYIKKFEESPWYITPGVTMPFEQLSSHDMESLFWVLAFVLCRASIPGEKPSSTEQYEEFCEAMLKNDPGKPGDDSRSALLNGSSAEKWENRLHPKLRPVASMLHVMAKYFAVQWVYWKKYLDEDHAHDMMRRVLLDHVVHVRKEGDVELDLKRPRPYPASPALALKSPPKKKSRGVRTRNGPSRSVGSGLNTMNSIRENTAAEEALDVFTANGNHLMENVFDIMGQDDQDRSSASLGKRRRPIDEEV